MNRKVLALSVILLAAAGFTLIQVRMRRRPRVQVVAAEMRDRTLARGEIIPTDGIAPIFADAEAKVLSVAAREGDHVKAGDVLAELDAFGTLIEVKATADADVLVRRIAKGGKVHSMAGPAMFDLADTSRTEIRIEVEERHAARVLAGQRVKILHFASGAEMDGVIDRVASQVLRRTLGDDDGGKGESLVRPAWVRPTAEIDIGKAFTLLVGQRVEIQIDLGKRAANSTIARSAISIRDGRAFVETLGIFGTREINVEVLSVDDLVAEVRGIPNGTPVLLP